MRQFALDEKELLLQSAKPVIFLYDYSVPRFCLEKNVSYSPTTKCLFLHSSLTPAVVASNSCLLDRERRIIRYLALKIFRHFPLFTDFSSPKLYRRSIAACFFVRNRTFARMYAYGYILRGVGEHYDTRCNNHARKWGKMIFFSPLR